jgi:RNA polymerase sigma-54 factor
MNIDMKLQMKMQQKLIMTPNLQLAIKLLQLTKLELQDVLEQNMLENPVLEVVNENEPEESSGPTQEERETTAEFEGERSSASEIAEVYPDTLPDSKPDEQPIRWEEIDEYLREEYDYGYTPKEQKDAVIFENITRELKGLSDVLSEQLLLSNHLTERQVQIGMLIIGNIDENGYLMMTIEEIAIQGGLSVDEVLEVLSVVQTFEPAGVAARDLRECMLLQIDQLYPDETLARTIVTTYLDELEKGSFQKIADKISRPLSEVQKAVEVILGLEPKPGRKYSTEEPRYIIPDVVITKVDGEYVVLLNDEGIPRLKISNLYLNILKKKKDFSSDTRDYIEKKLNSARWLIRSIEQRQQTLYKVSKSILNFQNDFFEKGIGYLKPLVLRDVAEDINMHESTVSRVSTNKYMHTPRGVYELKYFFHSGLSTTNGEDVSSLRIKETIRNLAQKEDSRRPLSDKKIAAVLHQQGINIARRTVAKYREELRIPPSNRRKKTKN